ncbi:hypothetical protein PR202_gb25631 [Eleusine coracana subsp. coracana]|uniref:C2 domain-containing protein n=1 Tax=Eleusine coracana subsp. coracana TaxID=191504 RepID=A0AAV5FPF5_ELECO|nr:hypothetical protein PR202_gb25631 [Eleusine coracana subsp. coracana]
MADSGDGPPLQRRMVVVEVVCARDLPPKDGVGMCNAYAVLEFDGQQKRTSTMPRDLNPHFWRERHEFTVPDPAGMRSKAVYMLLYHDRRFNPSPLILLVGSPTTRGEVGLKVYYYDEPSAPSPPPPPLGEEDWSNELDKDIQVAPTVVPPLPEEQIEDDDDDEEEVTTGDRVQAWSNDLVEQMCYLFVCVVKVRDIRACEGPYIKVQTGPYTLRSRDGSVSSSGNPEWNQVFAISHAKPEPTLEVVRRWHRSGTG